MPDSFEFGDAPRTSDEILKQDFIKIKDFQIKFYMIRTISKDKRYNFFLRKPEYLIYINFTPIIFDEEKERDRIIDLLVDKLLNEEYISFIGIK